MRTLALVDRSTPDAVRPEEMELFRLLEAIALELVAQSAPGSAFYGATDLEVVKAVVDVIAALRAIRWPFVVSDQVIEVR